MGTVWGSLPLIAATDCCMTTTYIFISVKAEKGKLTKSALENVLLNQNSVAKGPLLRMVQIRTTSARGLKQLRAMQLDIISVSADSDRVQSDGLFSGGYVIKAVVTKGELAKLKAMGFEVSEVPEKN